MKFRQYYRSLGKKGKLVLYLVAFIALFSFIFTIATISFVGVKLSTAKRTKLPIEMKIPDISLKDDKGNLTSLAETPPMKKLLLFFKPKCTACRKELSNLEYLWKKYSPDKIKIFAISEVGEEETQRFLKTYAMSFPTLMDPDQSLKKIFKFHGTPALFLIDENNIIKYGRVGYEKLAFDERLIKEFLRSSKIPIEALGPS